ncbi:hypothetical protein D1007_31490 [Hordeum vulgare]|nr:hypothetical protein D1007_31490 [Hordeum vulgare]
MSEELMVYGHGIERLAFFHMEIPDVTPLVPSLSAIVMVLGHRNYRPKFSVVFLDIASQGRCTQSDEITLALNKLVVDISEPKLDLKVVAVLDTA